MRTTQGTSMRLLAAALLVGSASGCLPDRLEKTESELRDAIAEAMTRGDTATVRLFIEVPFAFERLYIAGPGTAEPEIAAALKSDAWRPEMSRGIEGTEQFHLFVFETRGKLVAASLPRSVVDIDPALTGKMYDPESAWFRVTRPEGAIAPVLVARSAP